MFDIIVCVLLCVLFFIVLFLVLLVLQGEASLTPTDEGRCVI